MTAYCGPMSPSVRLPLAVIGGLIYAAAGALIGSQNAGWFGLGREANDVLPLLGVGAALVAVAFTGTSFSERLKKAGALGVASRILVVVGCVLFIMGSLIDFAIFGTLSLAAGLIFMAVAVTRHKLVSVTDRILIIASAVGSITWNTETTSAFLLVGVGLIWIVLAVRLIPHSPSSQRSVSASIHPR